MKTILLSATLLAGALSLSAAIQTKTIEYKQDDTTLEGVLTYDDSILPGREVDAADGRTLADFMYQETIKRLNAQLAEEKKSYAAEIATKNQNRADELKARITEIEKEIAKTEAQVESRNRNRQGKRPGVLIVHQWLGLTDHEKHRAEMLAQLGYVAFCADIFGKGVRPKDTTEAGAQASKYKKDRALLRARVNAGLEELKRNELVDTNHVAAIGYCFGGTTVIELARSGADVAGVVSFHGGLDSPAPADGKNIKCKVLACHGADDPFAKAEDLAAFEREMRDAKVDWRLNKYGGAVHSFTQPMAGNDNSKGAAYNEKADKRSWEDMKLFFGEIFK